MRIPRTSSIGKGVDSFLLQLSCPISHCFNLTLQINRLRESISITNVNMVEQHKQMRLNLQDRHQQMTNVINRCKFVPLSRICGCLIQ